MESGDSWLSLLDENPFVQRKKLEAEEKGLEEGLQKGLQEGRQEGRAEGLQEAVVAIVDFVLSCWLTSGKENTA